MYMGTVGGTLNRTCLGKAHSLCLGEGGRGLMKLAEYGWQVLLAGLVAI